MWFEKAQSVRCYTVTITYNSVCNVFGILKKDCIIQSTPEVYHYHCLTLTPRPLPRRHQAFKEPLMDVGIPSRGNGDGSQQGIVKQCWNTGLIT